MPIRMPQTVYAVSASGIDEGEYGSRSEVIAKAHRPVGAGCPDRPRPRRLRGLPESVADAGSSLFKRPLTVSGERGRAFRPAWPFRRWPRVFGRTPAGRMLTGAPAGPHR